MTHLDLATLYILASVLAFAAYGIDKAAAIGGFQRIPEALLHIIGLAGGWPGAFIAQRVFRHKTRKTSFRIIFRAVAALNITATLWLLSVTS